MHATPNPYCTRALFALLVVFLMPLPAGAQVLAAAPLAPPVNAHETAPSTEARPARPSDKPGSRDADLDFAVLMKRHQQDGVDIANAEIANGRSTKMKALARRIVSEQQKEIAELDQWLVRNKWRVTSK